MVPRIQLLLLILLAFVQAAQSQKTTRIIVVDSVTFEPLPAVFVQVKNINRGMLTDNAGVLTITTQRTDTLVISHVGYNEVILPLFFEEDAILVRLSEKVMLLREVTVSSRRLYPNEVNPRRSNLPQTATWAGSLASPWDYFNKREREKRKLARLMIENDRTKTFMEVITDPSIKEELMLDHSISETEYYDILVKFNQLKFSVIYSNDAEKIIEALHDFFSKNKGG